MKTPIAIFPNLSMLFVAIIWGSTYIIIKNCTNDVPIFSFFFYRFFSASILIAGILFFLRKNPLKHFKYGMILGLLLLAALLTQALALNRTSATNTGFISGLFVFFVPILNFLIFRKNPQKNIIFPCLFVSIGLWTLTEGPHGFGFGEFIALLSSIIFALYILCIDIAVKNIDIWVLNFQQFAFIAIISFILSLILHSSFAVTSFVSIWEIFYLSTIASVVAMAMQFKAQKTILPFNCALILSLEPVFAAFFARLLGQEILTFHVVVGGIFILSAILILQWSKRGERADSLKDR